MIDQNIVLFDDIVWEKLLPFTFTRPVAEIRVGITTITEKWKVFASSVSWHTQDYLATKYPSNITSDNLFVRGNVIPSTDFIAELKNLEPGIALVKDDVVLAFRGAQFQLEALKKKVYEGNLTLIENSWDIFEKNDEIIRFDFETLTKGRTSAPLSATNNVLNPENIFLEEGAKAEFATIDASGGPVYLAKDAEIMAGALIQGPLALEEHSVIKMGAKIYGATTVGPWCKVAGEIQNSVIFGYSNKGHDGYLGNAVLGEWCNIGADSNNSNLKNNYDKVKLWDYSTGRFARTGLQFCGLMMGDHSKCGINTMFNTGTVIGVSSNIFGSGFPRNFVPSFSWGGASGFALYTLKKALETAEIVMGRRKIELGEIDKNILEAVFEYTNKYRKY